MSSKYIVTAKEERARGAAVLTLTLQDVPEEYKITLHVKDATDVFLSNAEVGDVVFIEVGHFPSA